MSKLFGGNQSSAPDYTSIQVNVSTNQLAIPLIWGQAKVGVNLIWYQNFQTHDGSGGKGGGKGSLFNSGSSSTSYVYSADIMLALCEGPISGIGYIWKDQSVYTLADLGLTLIDGATPQSVWSYLATYYPSQALAYNGTAMAVAPSYNLGASATVGNHNFEVLGVLAGTGFNAIDADPAQVIQDFVTNPIYGAASATGATLQFDLTQLYGASGDGSYQTYCRAVGLAISPCLVEQENAQSIVKRWLDLTNTAGVWSPGVGLKLIPFGDETIPPNVLSTITEVREVQPNQQPGGYPPVVVVSFAQQFTANVSVVYTSSGDALTQVFTTPVQGQYYESGGSYTFNAADTYNQVSITYTYTNPVGWTPSNITPVYALTDDDFVAQNDSDPIDISRSDPYEAYNIERLTISQRDNQYAYIPIEARDQDAVERYGPRIDTGVQAYEICDQQVAITSAQLILQRGLYIRNTYTFTLSWEYCLLEPMDLVTLTQPPRLNNAVARITAIEEGDDGLLKFTAEEFPQGVATTVIYAATGSANTPINRAMSVDPVNVPVIFEPTIQLLQASNPGTSVPQVWIAASGGEAGIADPNWGGANVLLSVDDATFSQIGQVTQAARQGTLTAILATYSGSNPDTVNTLSVNLSESGGSLETSTDASAAAGATVCYVDGEYISYSVATLTSANNYNLTRLWRGQFGSTVGAHAGGTQFAALDAAVFRYTLPSNLFGQMLYFKLQSFNVFGQAVQDIATCTVYTYTPSGPAAPSPPTSLTATVGSSAGATVLSCTNPSSPGFTGVQFYRAAHGAGFGAAVTVNGLISGVAGGTSAYTDTVPTGTYDYYAVALNTAGISSSPDGPATVSVVIGSTVTSVSNSDGTLSISPTTGAVLASRAAITGDVSISAGSNTATLASIITAAGPIGGTSVVPQITYDAKGRLTTVTGVSLAISPGAISLANGDILLGNSSNLAAATPLSGLTLPSPTLSGTVGGTPAWASPQTFPNLTTIGNGVSGAGLIINGNAAGAVVAFDNAGAITVQVGNESGVLGSGSDLKAVLYSATYAYRLFGLGAGTLQTDSSGNISVSSVLPLAVVNVQTFSSSGTYTPSSNILYSVIECWGGGGGGGVPGGAVGFSVAAGGGAAGNYSRKTVSASAIGASQIVTIGAGGASGGSGGATSVGSLCVANGGLNGSAGGLGGSAGAAGTGDINSSNGSLGGNGFYDAGLVGLVNSGGGGSSLVGSGGAAISAYAAGQSVNGNSGVGYGSGGSGGAMYNTATVPAGGVGTGGFVTITEFIG